MNKIIGTVIAAIVVAIVGTYIKIKFFGIKEVATTESMED